MLSELDAALDEAKEAGERVRRGIENLKQIFGETGISAPLSVSVIEPTVGLPVEQTIPCPYCGKRYPVWHRRRGHDNKGRRYRVVRHIGMQRLRAAKENRAGDHGQLKDPIPWP